MVRGWGMILCRFGQCGLDMGIRENTERSFLVPLALSFDQTACAMSAMNFYLGFSIHLKD